MYARLVRSSFGPGKHAAAQEIDDNIAPLMSAQSGCQGLTVFGDETDDEYGIFVLLDTEDKANAAAQLVRPKLNDHLAGHAKAPPNARLFKVLS